MQNMVMFSFKSKPLGFCDRSEFDFSWQIIDWHFRWKTGKNPASKTNSLTPTDPPSLLFMRTASQGCDRLIILETCRQFKCKYFMSALLRMDLYCWGYDVRVGGWLWEMDPRCSWHCVSKNPLRRFQQERRWLMHWLLSENTEECLQCERVCL